MACKCLLQYHWLLLYLLIFFFVVKKLFGLMHFFVYFYFVACSFGIMSQNALLTPMQWSPHLGFSFKSLQICTVHLGLWRTLNWLLHGVWGKGWKSFFSHSLYSQHVCSSLCSFPIMWPLVRDRLTVRMSLLRHSRKKESLHLCALWFP